MSASFCHLHNHTEYSLLDGANRIEKMVLRAKELEMEALAISDHGVMFGAMEFYWAAKKHGIKPIVGVEAYVAPKGIENRSGKMGSDSYHLLLLAKDEVGYRNLCKLSSIAALEGYYYKPRVDHDILRKFSEGVIATSACLGSEICGALMDDDYPEARRIAEMYAEIFGQENFFIELQDHGLAEQARIREPLIRIAKELNLPLIATNDAHYLCKSDAKPHDVLLCIQTGSMVADERRMKFEGDEFYLKSQEEMKDLFQDVPEAIENTLGVAERCGLNIEGSRAPMPQPMMPEGVSSSEFLRLLCEEGLSKRSNQSDVSITRLNYELDVISKTGFEDYFLLVKEFADATRERGIHFGVRGSAAGSLVAYCLGVTDVDPIEYDLTFERFLNPERISMPDIDMDFEDARRDEIIQYVTDRFGKDHVAQIVTFGTLGAKAALRDCGRVMGYPIPEVDRLCKTLPTLPGLTLDGAYKEVKEFAQAVDADPKLRELFTTAKSVEGITRQAGVHAAGVVISREPLVEYVPLYRGTDGQAITAFEMGVLEKLNLLKMDFLGLSNLTVIARTTENIQKSRGEGIDMRTIPLDDAKTFELLGRGETSGVFQLEGGGMTRYIQELKPNSVKELAAMVALYRPGPLDHIPRFIDTKFGRQKPVYLHERMRPILEETYGVIVYQDQVLKLVQSLAGFTLGRADVLRRAMGKKDLKSLESMKVEFEEGCAKNEIDDKTVKAIWDLLIPFANYAFNKAHAVCYSILAYQTAYLKSNYPVEYMAALLSVYRDNDERLINFMSECQRMKIRLLQPDVNQSNLDFALEGDSSIRFGLAAIKGVGESVSAGIIDERAKGGAFTHLYEFTERVRSSGLTRTALEPLIKSGALDSIDKNRNRLLAALDGALLHASQMAHDKLVGQDSLFLNGAPEQKSSVAYPPITIDVPTPTVQENLAMEKEVIGQFVSDHPLRGYERVLDREATMTCEAFAEAPDRARVKLAGIISSIVERRSKKSNEKYAMGTIEDLTGQARFAVFSKALAACEGKLSKGEAVVLAGNVRHSERNGEQSVELMIFEAQSLVLTEEERIEEIPLGPDDPGLVKLKILRSTEQTLRRIKSEIGKHPGAFPVHIIVGPEGRFPPLPSPLRVDPLGLTRALSGVSCVSVAVLGERE